MKRIKHILSNNFFVLKLLYKASPLKVWLSLLFTIWGCVLQLVTNVFLVRTVVDELQAGSNYGKIVIVVVGTFLFNWITGSVMQFYNTFYLPKANIEINRRLQKMFYNKVFELDIACFEQTDFYDRYVIANVIFASKVHESIQIICDFLTSVIMMFSMSFILFEIDPLLVVFSVIPFLYTLITGGIVNKFNHEYSLKEVPQNRRVDYSNRIFYLMDYVKEMRMTKIFRNILKIYHDANDKLIALARKYSWKSIKFNALDFSSGMISSFGAQIYIAFRTIISKTVSLGNFFVAINSVGSVSSHLQSFASIFHRLGNSSLYVDDLKYFFEYKPNVSLNENGPKVDTSVKPAVQIKNVSFKYISQENECLKHINMNIRPGEKIAIVGNNGAGKSTLVKLLMRLYDVTDGQILLNGTDIKQINLDSYRALFGTVFQDYQVLALSVAENVLMRKCETEEDRKIVENALRESGIWDKVCTFENGMDTLLTREFSDKGVILSGGEFQKIALARVFAKPCEIVILDEPSSALDPIAEYNMYENMMRACEGKIVVFISHRLSSAVLADTVYYLENGQIAEQGTHRELMKLGGKYAKMFLRQAEKYRGSK